MALLEKTDNTMSLSNISADGVNEKLAAKGEEQKLRTVWAFGRSKGL